MGGEFSAESPSGLNGDTGKKIEFTLNLYSNDKPVKNLQFSDIISFEQLKALVITGNNSRDEEILGILHKLGLTLTVTSFQKSTIAQLKAGLNFAEKRNYLIIILDDKEFDGFEAAQEIWENGLAQQFVIMMISSNDMNGNLLKCNKLGVDHYLLKSSEIKDLYEAIKISFRNIDKAAPVVGKESTRKDLRILVVDDNEMNQKVIGTMLKSLSCSFDFADDGFAALIQAKTRKYDIIFMDLIMPGMDGFESARKILEYNNTQLIVAFTADNLPETKRKAELSGIMEFIAKPVKLDDLKRLFSKYFVKA
jgi:CheY-like chemotaxis protein